VGSGHGLGPPPNPPPVAARLTIRMSRGRPIDPLVSADWATAAALKTCSVACKEIVAAYLSEEEAPRNPFGRLLLRAAAAIDAAAAALDAGSDKRRLTFAIAGPICRGAAARCRSSGLDPRLLRAAAACERAAVICEHRLRAN
jgi:hypothetical protein